MYDAGKIIIGLIIFVGLFTSPIWYDLLSGKAALKQPDLVIPSNVRSKRMRSRYGILCVPIIWFY